MKKLTEGRVFRWGLVLFLLAAGLSVAGFREAAAAETKVSKFRLGFGALNVVNAVVWVMDREGIYRKYGIDTRPIFFNGSLRSVQAMIAGELDGAVIGSTQVIDNNAAGAPVLKVVASLQDVLKYNIMVRPEIKKAEDLKGKSFAIGTVGGQAYFAALMSLQKLGLDPKRDQIAVVQMGNETLRAGALLSGGVAATVLAPEIAATLPPDKARLFLDLAKENVPWQHTALAVTQKIIDSDPQSVENLIKALGGGIAFMLDPANKAKAIASIADMLKMKDPKKLENAYQEAFETFRRKPYPNMEGVKFQLKLIADMKSHPGVEKLKVEDVVDDRFVKKLDQSGFFDQLPKGRQP